MLRMTILIRIVTRITSRTAQLVFFLCLRTASGLHIAYIASHKYTTVILHIASVCFFFSTAYQRSWIIKSGFVRMLWLCQSEVQLEVAFQVKIPSGNSDIPTFDFKWITPQVSNMLLFLFFVFWLHECHQLDVLLITFKPTGVGLNVRTL